MSELPSFQDFMRPLLELLEREAQPLRSRDAYEKLADTLKLDEAARAQLLPSGKQPTYRNRIGWASTYLRFAGLLHAPSRGVWAITPAGRAFLAKHVGRIDLRVLETIPAYVEARAAAESEDEANTAPSATTAAPALAPLDAPVAAETTPEEQLFAAYKRIVASVADELSKLVQKSDPAFFEELVIDLLGKMGYGTSDDARTRVGRSADGGIDGIISLDKLGFEKALSSKTRHPGEALGPRHQDRPPRRTGLLRCARRTARDQGPLHHDLVVHERSRAIRRQRLRIAHPRRRQTPRAAHDRARLGSADGAHAARAEDRWGLFRGVRAAPGSRSASFGPWGAVCRRTHLAE